MPNISLVIGSTGLIGKKLLLELSSKGDQVIAVTRRSIKNIPSDISILKINCHIPKDFKRLINVIIENIIENIIRKFFIWDIPHST